MEMDASFKYLRVHLTNTFTRIIKKADQCLFFLRTTKEGRAKHCSFYSSFYCSLYRSLSRVTSPISVL